MQHYDVAIIGGGPAGLTAAMTLSRSLRRVAVLESPADPRNAGSHGVHGILGLDGVSPAEYRSRAWSDLARYGMAELHETEAVDLVPDPRGGGFEVVTEDGGPFWARRVLLATGMTDIIPELEGFRECWGASIIHCPFCSGWENRERAWGVVTADPEFARKAPRAFAAWSDDVIVFTDGEAPAGDLGVETVTGRIRGLRHDGGDLRAVELDDGAVVERGTLLWQLDQRPVPLVSRLAKDRGLALREDCYVKTDGSCRTSVPGLYSAGDTITETQGAIESAASGSTAAFQIIEDETA
ncbi:pyridine nucleotide-disulfide oxidoreductase domain-containing protein [Planomonospora sphaerica]|uniref:Pyridine nucleotide-disulfide oxidoreductase domain-containing protein n=1 Tax=Planomonospora sphaerica TaxID=161355 RepID=A0A171CR35_9ACTN|nr:NAD(P)/FAD-dependent oxidoreductase [Planomonospora sphaerica]GAT67092.1 pyridine nucleotide-disulfide oxidoreductase domain-containing protein [Planomonospora sphaerica]